MNKVAPNKNLSICSFFPLFQSHFILFELIHIHKTYLINVTGRLKQVVEILLVSMPYNYNSVNVTVKTLPVNQKTIEWGCEQKI